MSLGRIPTANISAGFHVTLGWKCSAERQGASPRRHQRDAPSQGMMGWALAKFDAVGVAQGSVAQCSMNGCARAAVQLYEQGHQDNKNEAKFKSSRLMAKM